MRSRRSKHHANHERWLVSYADFITLLFAFFVVMYAFAKADQKKQAQVSVAIQQAFQSLGIFGVLQRVQEYSLISPKESSPATSPPPGNDELHPPDQDRNDLEQIRRQLVNTLAAQIKAGAISIEMGPDGLVISLREAGFFDSGSADPRPHTMNTLRTIATSLDATHFRLRVEGHTDNVPVHNAAFDSNWELSTARATRIARILLELHAASPKLLSAAGYAEFHPISSNKTEEGRAKNRRVDLIVMPDSNASSSTAGSQSN
jgi:chemotaxis protein MotB